MSPLLEALPLPVVLGLGKGTLVLILAALAAKSSRRASASGRHLIWMLGLGALLGLPILSLWLPPLEIEILPPAPIELYYPVDDTAATISDRGPGTESPAIGSATRVAVESKAALETDRGWQSIDWMHGLWLLGFAFFGGRLLFGLVVIHRLGRRATPARSPELYRVADALRRRLGISRPVRFLCHPEITTPAVWGWRRPQVLLPMEAESWDTEPLHDVLAHELAHIERGDWLSQALARAARAVYWFHPLVWLAYGRLCLESERAADDRVLELGTSAPDYAQRLLDFARRQQRRTPTLALTMARPTGLESRIRSILDPRLRRREMQRNHLLLAGLSTLALLLFLSPSTLVRADAPTTADPSLMEAVDNGNLDLVRQQLDAGKDPEGAERGKGTVLIRAAHAGHLDVVRELLDRGADPNGRETEGPRILARTPLTAAAAAGHLEIVELLLDRGAEPKAAPKGDASALMAAASRGHVAVAKRLIGAGADADRAIRGDGSPLIRAAGSGSAEMVQLLLAAGADPNRSVRGDGAPLIRAAAAGDTEIVRLLLAAGARPDISVRGDGNPMSAATSRGHGEVVRLLIDHGADIDAETRGDGTALIRASSRGDVELARSLLDRGADPNRSSRGDGNPLIAAARGGHLALVQLLLDRGADIDRVVPGDENALIQAAGHGRLEVVRLLVDRGADIHKQVEADRGEIRTPVGMAERGGHDAVVDFLRNQGARG